MFPFGRPSDVFGRSLEFKKIPAFLCRHGVGRQLAPVQTTGKHRPDTEILDKEITCIQSTFVWTSGKHRLDTVLSKAITFKQVTTVRNLGQHRLNVALIWKRVKCVIERKLYSNHSDALCFCLDTA
jgi:hypothetical protein